MNIISRNMKLYSSESEVQNDYEEEIKKAFGVTVPFIRIPGNSGAKTDGVLEVKQLNLKLLAEFKFKNNLENDFPMCVCQVLCYIKMMETHGINCPNVILIGNELYCYLFHIDKITKYLDKRDWLSYTPCSVGYHDDNKELLNEIRNDPDLVLYKHDLSRIEFKEIIDEIVSLNYKTTRKLSINEINITRFFGEFVDDIIVKKEKDNSYTPNQLVSLFMTILNTPTDVYIHPTKKNILVSSVLGEIKIYQDKYKLFFERINNSYTPKEKDNLTEICDRLIEDLTRRNQGEFYTPIPVASKGEIEIEKIFGRNWKEEYIVWDPACGVGNLTKYGNFSNLYLSTLHKSDLDIIESRNNYGQQLIKFQYDFLNDDISEDGLLVVDRFKLHPGLIDAFKNNKKIIIFMNPPYSMGGNLKLNVGSKGKKDSKKTLINKAMKAKKLGSACSQLYLQFLYRIISIKETYNLTNLHLAFFSKPGFLTSVAYKKFRELFLNNFTFVHGELIKSSLFSGASNWWAVSFSIFKSGKTPLSERLDFNFDICETNSEFAMEKTKSKIIYNLDNKLALDSWVKQPTVNLSMGKKLGLSLKGGLNYEATEIKHSNLIIGSIHAGYNSMRGNEQYCGIYSGMFSYGNPIIKENFYKAIISFVAKRSMMKVQKWFDDSTEYSPPTVLDEKFVSDCLIYSLFNANSNQTSIREGGYYIINEWFWLSNEFIKNLSNENFDDIVYGDSNVYSGDRFVFKEIQDKTFSDDAKCILNLATDLVVKSFPLRKKEDHYNKLQLKSWDSGWFQIRKLLEVEMKEELANFKKLYIEFETRMREEVLRRGFLKHF